MSGDGSFYDGWSGMKQLQEGDPALVRREKGHRYSLTTQVISIYINYLRFSLCLPCIISSNSALCTFCKLQPPETSGRAVAHALHILAHREGLCTCGNPPPV